MRKIVEKWPKFPRAKSKIAKLAPSATFPSIFDPKNQSFVPSGCPSFVRASYKESFAEGPALGTVLGPENERRPVATGEVTESFFRMMFLAFSRF